MTFVDIVRYEFIHVVLFADGHCHLYIEPKIYNFTQTVHQDHRAKLTTIKRKKCFLRRPSTLTRDWSLRRRILASPSRWMSLGLSTGESPLCAEQTAVEQLELLSPVSRVLSVPCASAGRLTFGPRRTCTQTKVHNYGESQVIPLRFCPSTRFDYFHKMHTSIMIRIQASNCFCLFVGFLFLFFVIFLCASDKEICVYHNHDWHEFIDMNLWYHFDFFYSV